LHYKGEFLTPNPYSWKTIYLAQGSPILIGFQTHPASYQHWQLDVEGSVATLTMAVNEAGGLFDGYALKLNSYDLGVDIELFDAISRLRFEHPQVKVVVLRSALGNVFCAGANIRMLAGAEHVHKVNFCKFTNETRCTMEAAGADSGQYFISVIQGACAGGGYELALATDYLLLADDSNSSVALPEVPLLAVLPGTGGLTRLTDKRRVRRDLTDVFCTLEEGIKGRRAVEWNLVDEIAPRSTMQETVDKTVKRFCDLSEKTGEEIGIELPAVQVLASSDEDNWIYPCVSVRFDRDLGVAEIMLEGPRAEVPVSTAELHELGPHYWGLQFARELDEILLQLRFNEVDTGVLVYKSHGDALLLEQHANWLTQNRSFWLANEILCLWTRLFKRIDLMARSQVALIEPGSCFSGPFLEVALACDRSYMLDGQFEGESQSEAELLLSENNFGTHPMINGQSRLEARFAGCPDIHSKLRQYQSKAIKAEECYACGLITFAYDDIDWEDEIRVFLEERASFSADALTAMEANLRIGSPETMESRIFGRLSAWQNWVFQRPNAVGENGALRRYGSGKRADYDRVRV